MEIKKIYESDNDIINIEKGKGINKLTKKLNDLKYSHKIINDFLNEIYNYFYYKEYGKIEDPYDSYLIFSLDDGSRGYNEENRLFLYVINEENATYTNYTIYDKERNIDEYPNILNWLENKNIILDKDKYNL